MSGSNFSNRCVVCSHCQLNAVTGTEVGCSILEKMADNFFQAEEGDGHVLATAMASVLAHLQKKKTNVAGCSLAYDFIRKLVLSFGSADVEAFLI